MVDEEKKITEEPTIDELLGVDATEKKKVNTEEEKRIEKPKIDNLTAVNATDKKNVSTENVSLYNKGNDKQSKANEIKEESKENLNFSSVSLPPKKQKLFFVLFIVVMLGIVYYAFFVSADKPKEVKKELTEKDKTNIVKKSIPVPKVPEKVKIDNNETVKSMIKVPVVQKPKAPPPPPPPLPLPAVVATPPSPQTVVNNNNNKEQKNDLIDQLMHNNKESDEEKQARLSRMKSSIMVSGGGGGAFGSDKKNGKGTKDKADNKGFLGFGDGKFDDDSIQESDAAKVQAKAVNNLHRTILQGKIIEAVLETAVNTDIPGTLRAVVSRDVYADHGDAVLIPMGSRLLGSYQSGVSAGQTRVAIMWNRLIRPDGIDIDIGSQGVDPLGRTGVAGKVYNHLWERLSNAFMVSFVVPVTAAQAAQKATKASGTSTSSTTGGLNGPTTTITQNDPVSDAIQQSTDDFSNIVKDVLNDSLKDTPTITIDQGTKVNVFVQKDLVFPSQRALQKRKLFNN